MTLCMILKSSILALVQIFLSFFFIFQSMIIYFRIRILYKAYIHVNICPPLLISWVQISECWAPGYIIANGLGDSSVHSSLRSIALGRTVSRKSTLWKVSGWKASSQVQSFSCKGPVLLELVSSPGSIEHEHLDFRAQDKIRLWVTKAVCVHCSWLTP